MKKFIYLLPIIALSIFSCKSEDQGNLELNFVATFDGQPIATDGTLYGYQNDQKIQFERIKFFIAEIELENTDGSVTSVSDVELIDLSGKDDVTAAVGESLVFEKIKTGDYNGITFHVGLSERLNNQNPSEVDGASPLHDGTYWSDWGSYIFTSISGKADLNQDDIPEHNMVYHIGGNESIRPKNFPGAVSIQGGSTTQLNFTFDLREMLMANGIPFNIEEFNAVHTDKVIMEDLADRMVGAFTRK